MNSIHRSSGRCRVTALAVAGVLATVPAAASSARSAEGFGAAGVVALPEETAANAVAVQPDGKIVVASERVLFRLRSDGHVDASFRDGRLRCPVPATASPLVWPGCSDFALGADGRIVVVGGDSVVRLTPAGRPDPTFGGRRVANVLFTTVAVARDGAIVAGGRLKSDGGVRGALVRLQPSGALDRGFGSHAVVMLDPSAGVPRDLALQPDGVVVVADWGVFRYRADGSRDESFPGGALPPEFLPRAVAMQDDGKVVVGGSHRGNGRAMIARIEERGGLDRSFGSGGIVDWEQTNRLYSEFVTDVALQADGEVVAAVASASAVYKGGAWSVRRVTALGRPAGSAGGTGMGYDPDRDCWGESPLAVAVQPDGKVVTAGGSCPGLLVARYSPTLAFESGPGAPPLRLRSVGHRSAAVVARRRPGDLVVTARIALNKPAHVSATLSRRGPRGLNRALPLRSSSRIECPRIDGAPECMEPAGWSVDDPARTAVWGPRTVRVRLVVGRTAVGRRGRLVVIVRAVAPGDETGARLMLPVDMK